VAVEAALGLQPVRHGRVHVLLHFRITTLLEDLDEDEFVRSLEAEVGVLADELVRLVLSDDLEDKVNCSLSNDVPTFTCGIEGREISLDCHVLGSDLSVVH